MDRRSFLRSTLGLSTVIVSSSSISSVFHTLSAQQRLEKAVSPYDLVAVRGGEPDVMFRRGIDALGGMSTFVKKGSRVVIKPNIGWDVTPERAANTNPKLVGEVVKACLEAGAREVVVFDHTCDQWQRCYSNSGIEKAVLDAGGKLIPGHSEGYYHPVQVNGKALKEAKEHEAVLNADVFINIPVLKHHGSTKVSIAMKNLMGNVWNRGIWHATDLHQCIADFAAYRKTTLTIIDAYAVMKRNGPRGVSVSDVTIMKAQIISKDIVAADAAAVKLFGLEPESVHYIRYAAEMNVGTMNLEKLNIKRIAV
ncbi:MAG: DUF362 domain-containing protein [Bacteroidetes bacterium]|nr:DUF362 domain-containing protein [Bacteroidota bacterium]